MAAAAAAEAENNAGGWAALPGPALEALLLQLPLEERARCACVCRAWRCAASDPALWLRLDLSAAVYPRTAGGLREAVLRGAGLEMCFT